MGLETSHDCWRGSYINFGWWRLHLARAGGYKLEELSEAPWTEIVLPWEIFNEENYMGDWSNGPAVEDPLIYLLVHSDIEGVIHPEQGRHLAERMDQILPALTVEGGPDLAARMEQANPGLTAARMTDEWLQMATQRFIKGLRVAADVGQDVVFF